MADPRAQSRPRVPAAPPAPEAGALAWSGGLFGPAEVERLVDRLTVALHGQMALVRELAEAREALEREKREADEARRTAERARETLETFLRALGHDLRAPFVAVDATLQLLELEAPGLDPAAFRARALADATELRRSAAHGLALLADLFELIRSDAGQWRVEPRMVALDELLQDLRSVVHAPAHAKSIALEVVAHAAPVAFETDPVRLRQALANLVLNAIQYAPNGSIRIEIDAIEGERIRFRVLDEGPGLPPNMANLFEPFVRGATGVRSDTGLSCRANGVVDHRAPVKESHSSTNASTNAGPGLGPGPGLGLGLAIARRCATLLGGTLTAANRPARGAAFTLEIPCRLGPSAAAAGEAPERGASRPSNPPPTDPTSGARSPTPTEPAARPHRILVVDDAADARRLLLHHLRALGQHAAAAASLAEAHALLAVRTYDLVIVDRRLGDGDGTSLAAHPAVVAHHTPLVVSSADPGARPGDPDATLLPKPVDRRAIERLLAAHGRATFPPARG